VDVKDVSRALILLMESEVKNQRFIVSGFNLKYRDLFDMIANSLQVTPPKYLAKKWMSEIIWRLLVIPSFFTGKTPMITKETSGTANSVYKYSSDKLLNTIDFNYTPIQKSIERIGKSFIEDHKK